MRGARFAVAAALWSTGVLAAELAGAAPRARPYDAPEVEVARAQVPRVPADYQTHDDAGIRFAYAPLAGDRVRPLIAKAPTIRSELSNLLGREVLASIEIRIAAAHSEMNRVAPADLPGYATAGAFFKQGLIVMSLTSPLSLEARDLEPWLRHALAHAALDEAAGGNPLPRWLHEGFAIEHAGERAAARAEALCLASLGERMIPLRELDAHFPADAPPGALAFAQAADLTRFLLDGKRERFQAMLERVRAGEGADTALQLAYGSDAPQLELSWRRAVAKRYAFLPVLLGATLLWIVIAMGLFARRLRARRKALANRRSRRFIEREARAALATARLRTPTEPEEIMDPIPLEADVPKVEHDGQWYTLH
jgi:hypothetical protein